MENKTDFLSLDEIKNLATEVTVKSSTQLMGEEQLDQIKNKINLTPVEELGKGECLYNAVKTAEISGADIIEGVALVVVVERDGKQSETVIKHAWNLIKNDHFDVTKDFVWPSLSAKLEHIEYLSVSRFKIHDYDVRAVEFKSNVDFIASSLRYLRTRDRIIIALYSNGLNEKYFEEVLNDSLLIAVKR